MKKTLTLILMVFSFQYDSPGQDQHLIDSLLLQLKSQNISNPGPGKNPPSLSDTTAAKILYQLSKAYWGNNPGKAMEYTMQSLSLSEQIGYKKGMGNALNGMGNINNFNGDYIAALSFHKKALLIREEIGDKQGIAASYNNIGNICYDQGNFPEALKNYLASLKIEEEIKNENGIAESHISIGSVYFLLGNFPEALKNYFTCLKIAGQTGNKLIVAYSYTGIGNIYDAQGNYSGALTNHFAALKAEEEIGDKEGIAASYNNIGEVYGRLNNYTEALKNHFISLKLREESGDKDGITMSYNNIGYMYIRLKKHNEASQYINKALTLAKEIGNQEYLKLSYQHMAMLDSAQGDFMKALEHYKMYISARDNMFNEENTKKTVQLQMQYDFDKKESLAKAAQQMKDAMAQKELQKQKLVRNGFIGGFAAVLLFAGVIFIQRNKISNGKKRSDELLLNILPSEVAEELKKNGRAEAKQFDHVTVMFTDFKNFTKVSETLTPSELVNEIHTCFKAFDHIMDKFGIEKIKTIGDSYMCAGGLPVVNLTHATDMVTAALEILQFMQQHMEQRKREGKVVFEIRTGIHTGPVVAGIVGVKKFAYDIWGDTVNMASRMESSGEAGKINISSSTYALIKDQFSCTHRGKIDAKNKGEVDMYFIERNLALT